jgi:hypothetical protein
VRLSGIALRLGVQRMDARRKRSSDGVCAAGVVGCNVPVRR